MDETLNSRDSEVQDLSGTHTDDYSKIDSSPKQTSKSSSSLEESFLQIKNLKLQLKSKNAIIEKLKKENELIQEQNSEEFRKLSSKQQNFENNLMQKFENTLSQSREKQERLQREAEHLHESQLILNSKQKMFEEEKKHIADIFEKLIANPEMCHQFVKTNSDGLSGLIGAKFYKAFITYENKKDEDRRMNDKLQEYVSLLKIKLEKTESGLSLLKQSLEEKESELKKVRSEVLNLKIQNPEVVHKISNYSQLLKNQEKQKLLIKELSLKIENLQTSLKDGERQQQSLQDDFNLLQQSEDLLKSDKLFLQEQVVSLQAQILKEKQSSKKTFEENDFAQAEIKRLSTILRDERKGSEIAKAQCSNSLSHYKHKYHELREESDSKMSHFKSAFSDYYKSQLNEKEEMMERIRTIKDSEIKSLSASNSKLKAQLSSVKQEMSAQLEEMSAKLESYEALAGSNDAVNKQLIDFISEQLPRSSQQRVTFANDEIDREVHEEDSVQSVHDIDDDHDLGDDEEKFKEKLIPILRESLMPVILLAKKMRSKSLHKDILS